MTQPGLASPQASIRQRLLNIAHARDEEFQSTLTRYGIERLLYRIAVSARDRFVLKGAAHFYAWEGNVHRQTRDLDLLGFDDPTPAALVDTFRRICSTDVEPDGLTFMADTIRAAPIREENEYGGLRVTMIAILGTARIPLQVDVGFGDAVTPKLESIRFPTLLDMPAPVLNAYPPETVVAEKYQAMVSLGIANGRMKDFYDVYVLSAGHMFDGQTLADAIAATFERRRTDILAEPPLALTNAFGDDATKRRQWSAFLNRGQIAGAPQALPQVTAALAAFLLAPSKAARTGSAFVLTWLPGIGWRA